MVAENQIDLLKEFAAIRNCQLISLSTYSFDPIFFDHMVLSQLRKGNPNAKIVVLVDSNHFDAENCTELTGADYRVLTLPSVFHPKMFIFCGKSTSSIIGSHNITLTGFTHSLEISCKLDHPAVTFQCLNCVKDLLSLFLDSEDQTLLDIEEQKLKIKPDVCGELYILSNLKTSILDQVIAIIRGCHFKVKEIKVISPFFSRVDEIVSKMKSEIKPKRITLCVQKNNHTLDPEQIDGLTYISVLEVRTKMRRRIHSKIILFKGQKDHFALVGSPNFTGPGLNEAFQVGKSNFETAILLKGERVSKLLSDLTYAKITKEEIKASRVPWKFETGKLFSCQIISANYDVFEGLRIELTSQRFKQTSYVKIQSLDRKTIETHKVDIDSKQTRIVIHPTKRIAAGATLWLCSENQNQISNKVCVNVFTNLRRITSMSKAEWLENMFANVSNSNTIGDLWRLLPLFLTSDELSVVEKGQSESRKGEYGYPSRLKAGTMTSSEIIAFLEDYFRSNRLKDYEIGYIDHASLTISLQNKTSIGDRIEKLILKFARYFEQKRLQTDTNPDEYTLYVLFTTKLCEILCRTFELYELFDSLLSNSISQFEKLYETYGMARGDSSRLLALLIFAKSEYDCRTKTSIIENVANRSNVIPSSIADIENVTLKARKCLLETVKRLAFTLTDEKAFLDFAEEIIISRLQRRINPWKFFVKDENVTCLLAEYFRSLIPECKNIPIDTFMKAAIGDEMAISNLYRIDCYPVVGSDQMPIFTTDVTPEEIVDNTVRILLPQFHLLGKSGSSGEKTAQVQLLKQLIIDDVREELLTVASRSGCQFIPGRILAKMKP